MTDSGRRLLGIPPVWPNWSVARGLIAGLWIAIVLVHAGVHLLSAGQAAAWWPDRDDLVFAAIESTLGLVPIALASFGIAAARVSRLWASFAALIAVITAWAAVDMMFRYAGEDDEFPALSVSEMGVWYLLATALVWIVSALAVTHIWRKARIALQETGDSAAR